MPSFFQELLVLYSIIILGYGAKRKKLINGSFDQATTQLILNITLPALILYSLNSSAAKFFLSDLVYLIILSFYSLGVTILISSLLAHNITNLNSQQNKIYQSLIVFGNQGFLGYAVIYSLFKETGIMLASVYNLPFLALIWTYGIYLMTGDKNTNYSWKTVIFNPGLLATCVGLILFFLPLQWPSLLVKFLRNVGSPTTPLSLLLIGSLLANLSFKNIKDMFKNSFLWSAATFKLLFVPLLFFPLKYTSHNTALLTIAVLLAGMPSAPTTALFAQNYNADAEFAAMGIFLSNLLSLFTLPLLYIFFAL